MHNQVFGTLLREWWERYLLRGNVEYAHEAWRRLEREVMPILGDKPPRKITPPMILRILRRIEARGTLVAARKVKSHISQAMRYGIACGVVTSDPTRDLTYALTPHKSRPRAALTDHAAIGTLMADIEAFRPRRRALSLKLAALTFVRPGELATAAWADISLEAALWRIPAERMKMKRPHQVPLSRQAVEAFRALHTLTGRKSPWCFPRRGDRSRPEGAGCLTYSLRCMGYDGQAMTGHGFRAMAATCLSELSWPSEVIERQLAHIDRNQVRAAYQRSELIDERRRMLQAWADWLDLQWARAFARKAR